MSSTREQAETLPARADVVPAAAPQADQPSAQHPGKSGPIVAAELPHLTEGLGDEMASPTESVAVSVHVEDEAEQASQGGTVIIDLRAADSVAGGPVDEPREGRLSSEDPPPEDPGSVEIGPAVARDALQSVGLRLSGSSAGPGLDVAEQTALTWAGYPAIGLRDIVAWSREFVLEVTHASRVSDPSRPEQATYRLRTATRDFAMKVYRADEKRARRLEKIFHMMDMCYRGGFPNPMPLTTAGGHYLHASGPYVIGIYDWLSGDNLLDLAAGKVHKMNPEQAYSAGQMLSRWHKLVDEKLHIGKKWSVDQFIVELTKHLSGWIERVSPYRASAEKIIHRFETDLEWFQRVGPIAPLHLQWTHGDATVRNFMFAGDQAIAIIDFDLASISPRLFDLIILLQAQPELMSRMLAGYRSVWELSTEERVCLPILAGARLLQRLIERLPVSLAEQHQVDYLQRLFNAYRYVKGQLREATQTL